MPDIDSRTGGARPRRTIRLRLALLYGALFLVSGAALLGIVYTILVQSTSSTVDLDPKTHSALDQHAVTVQLSPEEKAKLFGNTEFIPAIKGVVVAQRASYLRLMLIVSGGALLLMAGVSVVLGWLMSGRALRPVREMTGRARRLSEANLHERLAVAGPNDELKDLGDTFDGLLTRLDTAFEAQKLFVANASHELRTPLTVQRAMIEVALADPAADVESLRAVCQRVLVAGDDQARLIEALLTLARSQRGLDEWHPVNLATVVDGVLGKRVPDGVRIDRTLGTAWTSGDDRLLERLVTNLVDNAVRHNVSGGWVAVSTGQADGRPVVRIGNSGQVIAPDQVDPLFQPFARLESRTTHRGHGLGLSIVAAIATAHHADVRAVALPDGGLTVTVEFPPAEVPALTEPG